MTSVSRSLPGPARALHPSETALKSAGTKISVSHHKKPAARSKKKLLALNAPVHPHLGMRAALETPPGAKGLLQPPVFPAEEAGVLLPGVAESQEQAPGAVAALVG